MKDTLLKPDYVFEVSWEVCNKVGGIHTVLCTKAQLLKKEWNDQLIMIGPDLHTATGTNPEFSEDKLLFTSWRAHALEEGLPIRVGRWNIPGAPLVVLIDFTPLYQQKNAIFSELWIKFHLDSLSGQWDYIEPALFGYAAAKVIACFYEYHLNSTDKIIVQFHEWMTGAGILYLEDQIPQIATVFTTHATVLGRAIAGSGQPFYSRFPTFNAEQMARDLNVVAKQSLEKTAANMADCFTVVSEFTARECEKFLGRQPDFITPNGFDDSFVPPPAVFTNKRIAARKKILEVATALLQQALPENTLLVIKSGRYEFRNKGIDVFINSMALLNEGQQPDKTILAVIFVPAHQTGPREILQRSLQQPDLTHPRTGEVLTHNLQGADTDPILNSIRQHKLDNAPGSRVKILFVPTYLNGDDGIFNMPYYDILIGFDLAIFPSYYEPWGYTPLEGLAFHIPAVTTTVSGFGMAVSRLPDFTGEGIYVVERNDNNEKYISSEIADIVRNYAAQPDETIAQYRAAAAAISRKFWWNRLIERYKMAYDFALQKSGQRESLFREKPQAVPVTVSHGMLEQRPVWRNIEIQSALPTALKPLLKISSNLWWTWNRNAYGLFKNIDAAAWARYHGNPIKLIKNLSYKTIRRLESDKAFIDRLTALEQEFDNYLKVAEEKTGPLVAYFSMEYGLSPLLKLYAGGLGILAGDYLKGASDSNLDMIAVGLLYRQGYFSQKITFQGEQLAMPDQLDLDYLPVYPVKNDDGSPLLMQLAFPGRIVSVAVWKIAIGRTTLYLLDTDVTGNNADDRQITGQLYNNEPDIRLKQEILLGIGGVRMLTLLGIHPDIYHINEGHAAFTGFERMRMMMREVNLPYEAALEIIRATTQFTTHTVVPAAVDLYNEELLRTYLSYLPQDFNIGWDQIMALGKVDPTNADEKFSMFYLAARLSQEINAVSKLHQHETCRILQALWKDFRPGELHITAVTNGIHVPTWMAEEWKQQICQENVANVMMAMPDNIVWETRMAIKKSLTPLIRERLKMALLACHESPARIGQILDEFKENALFIGFARRFVSYKRPQILFTDVQRLASILKDKTRPVFILLAGKAHPGDKEGMAMLKQVIVAAKRPEFENRILFLEDYDMELAGLLVQGVDVWLNTPRLTREASGTSGMKAIWNGVLHCSTRDGWWAEAYREEAGWALESTAIFDNEELQDLDDAATLYDLLENKIIPLFFDRTSSGIPQKWISRIKAGMAMVAPTYSMPRVVADYQICYEKLYNRSRQLLSDQYKEAIMLAGWKKNIQSNWGQLHLMNIKEPANTSQVHTYNEEFSAEVTLYTGEMDVKDIGVEAVFSLKEDTDNYVFVQELTLVTVNGSRAVFACKTPLAFSGSCAYSFRIFPKHPLLPHRQDFPLVMWF
ncbi:alpha-glucan family phosphorylase [Chitinophaga polysaccharea]|uniref:alpha-glucan family phosphorylase n=1 Tax=Chitinophaga polysaccharea TaxID=1293035 RepID=UPI00145510AA|nr:alpha-glucan family phosphorylase [Chitinophaga polysaccharea]NLR62599.1 alpha-glucan family phosphorylase [Chitinophaga polysaccharea]